MKSLLTKFVGTVLTALVFGSIALSPAYAGGGGIYNWTDLSAQLSARQNRPVWAMAYADPYWYATDGQELWSGGHVWRVDGNYAKDITLEVRNAGLSRVDDIVSDGRTVIYLKNVTNRNNNFEMLGYNNNGTYTYPAYSLSKNLSSDEGIASIDGKDGVWSVVTTKGRVLFWNFSNMTGGSVVSSSSNWQNDHTYSTRKISPADNQWYLPTIAKPVSGGWLIGTRESNGAMRYWLRNDNGTMTDLTSKFSNYSTVAMAISNGTTALIVTTDNHAYTVENTNVVDRTSDLQYFRNGYSYTTNYSSAASNFAWNRAVGAWDSWKFLLTSGKKVAHFAPAYGTFSIREDVRDYFVTAAGNNRGTILFGGAESTTNNSQPSSPLMAKLVKAVDSNSSDYVSTPTYSNNFGGGRTYTSTNGPTVTTSGNPSNFYVGNGKTFVYRVTATDSQGVDRIDLYVNGARIKTCYADTCEYSNVYYTNGSYSRSVSFMARATDRSGWSTETNTEYVTVDQSSNGASSSNTSNTNGTITNGQTNVWDWVTPSVTSLKRSDVTTFGVGAWNPNGLNRIELWVNGSNRRTCTSDFTNCTTTIYGSDYNTGTTVSFNAKVVAANGQETWTTLRNLYISTDGSSTNNNGYSNGSISAWLEGNNGSWTLTNGASATYRVTASDPDGVNRIEVLLDNSVVKTCYTTSCDYTVGSAISGTTSKTISARMYDVYGNVMQTNTATISFVNNGYNNYGTLTANAWVDRSTTASTGYQQTWLNASASANNGLSRIEIYRNNNLTKTCNFNTAYGTQSCIETLTSDQFSTTQTFTFQVKAVDVNGQSVWSNVINVEVRPTNSTTYTPPSSTNTAGTLTTWSDYDMGYTNSSYVTVYASGKDADGVKQVEILVNSSVAKTCVFSGSNTSQSCSVLAGPFGTLPTVSYSARLTDAKGNVTTTPTNIIKHK